MIENFKQKFCIFYISERDVSIDESLMPFKGRLSGKQYILIKWTRLWIKFFKLCKAKSRYICDFVIYTESNMSSKQYVRQNCIKIMKFPQKLSYTYWIAFLEMVISVTVDNYYTSPKLADLLRKIIYNKICSR